MKPAPRIYFLDNLRAFVIILVVVLHGSITYMAFAPSWWYVLDPQNSLFFTALVLLIDVPIMLILFFIAGYFVFPSLAKRDARTFLRDKFVRVGLPWLGGALLLAPPTAYIIYYSRQVPMSFWEFWTTDFWGVAYQQSVYWFLGILFLLFLIVTLAYAASRRFRELGPKQSAPSWTLFGPFLAYTTIGFLTLNLIFPLDTWTHAGYLFMFQPLRVPLYVGYFALGIYAYLHGWFTTRGYGPRLIVWLPLFLGSGLLYLAYRFTIPAETQTTVVLKAGNALLFNTFCLSSLMVGLALFQRYLNGISLFWRSQAVNSYGIYYVHPLILYPLALLFVSISLPLVVKAPLVIVLALLLSWAFSALILKKVPPLNRVF